jgi:hypothetical protein
MAPSLSFTRVSNMNVTLPDTLAKDTASWILKLNNSVNTNPGPSRPSTSATQPNSVTRFQPKRADYIILANFLEYIFMVERMISV